MKLKRGDLVMTDLKNRWNLDCAGTVVEVHKDTADVNVWNLKGPGADVLVTGIPLEKLRLDNEAPKP